MKPGTYTTVEERKIIINLHNSMITMTKIAKQVNRPISTISSIIDRYGLTKSFQNKAKSGRPRKLDDRDKREIVRQVKINPKISAPTITAGLIELYGTHVHPETVRNVLRESNFHGRIARKKFFVSKQNRIKRMEFAKLYINKDLNFWKRWIFTDESKFNIFGPDGRCKVWRKANTELELKNMCGTIKHGGGNIMVWGCMSAAGVGDLHFVDGIMDQYQYINILKEHLRPSAERMGLADNYIFQQDNDPKHSALNTKLWLLYNTPKYIHTPPQSPDLNPIEHLWDELGRRIKKRGIKNRHDLRNALQQEWNDIGSEVTNNLVSSMPRRLQAVIRSNGNPTKY